MALKIRRQLVDVAATQEKKPGWDPPRYDAVNQKTSITIHETDNYDRGASAAAHANLQSNGYSDSWHWQVDDVEAVQSWPHDASLHHAGDHKINGGQGGKTSIAVEICVNADGNWDQARANAAELIRHIQSQEPTASAVYQHNHWSGKNCPQKLRSNGGAQWEQLLNAIKKTPSTGGEMSTTTTPALPTGTTEVKGINRTFVWYQGSRIAPAVLTALLKMGAAFKAEFGLDLLLTSGLRTYDEQNSLWRRWKGLIPPPFSSPDVAYPGTSRHETGLALDIRDSGSTPGVTTAGNRRSQWITNNSWRFGFKAGVVPSEPWHIEFQGDPWSVVAGAIKDDRPGGFPVAYIQDIQTRLINLGYHMGASGPDGSLGPVTTAQVKAFQKKYGLDPDGLPGPKTLTALKVVAVQKAIRATQDASVGPDTRKRLTAVAGAGAWMGRVFPYGVAYAQKVVGAKADNSWGPASIRAHDVTVAAIQRALGIPADGNWGPATDAAVKAIGG